MALRNSLLNRSTQNIIEALEERRLLSLTITNPDAVLGSDNRLFFNTIQNVNPSYPAEANNLHSSQPLILTNSGTSSLIISNVTTSGPFSVTNPTVAGTAETFPITLTAGQSLTVTVNFTQTTVPPHSGNETNFNDNTNDGASITGSLTITTNDPTTPTNTLALAGYFQTNSEDNDEPDLSQVVNTLAGYDTQLMYSGQANATYPTDFVNGSTSATYYGQEVDSAAWVPANTNDPVTITYLANFRTIGNTVNTFWYNSNGTDVAGGSHLLFSTDAAQGQTLLPSATQGGAPITGSFYPDGNFGFRVDDEYSYDAINVNNNNAGGGGHHFRFYPLIDSSGNAVPNAWIVAMDYAVIQSENYDFNDNVFIVTNMKPTSAPNAPAGLSATSTATPTLSWNAVTFTAGTLDGYNVYRATSPGGPFTLLTTSPTTATTYTDTNAPTGVTLYYQVTAVAAPSATDPTAPTESAPATATANTPAGPYAGSFTINAFTGDATSINVLLHDSDTAGTLLPNSVVVSNFSAGGSATTPDTNTGVFNYTSAASHNGSTTFTETFTYTVSDSAGHTSAPGTVTVDVAPPTATTASATNDSAVTLANTAVNIAVLDIDSPASGATFNLSTEHVNSAATNGTATVNSDGTITYTPGDNFVGNDSFQYTVTDTDGHSVNATVTLNVGVALTPNAGKTAVRAIKYTDSTGTPVTVTLNRGAADIYFAGNGTDQNAAVHGVLTLTGSVTDADIDFSSTTAASVLSITSPPKDAAPALGNITDNSAVGVILARTSKFVGTINLYGGVHELLLGSAGDDVSGTPYNINLGPSALVPATGKAINNDIVIVYGQVQNTDLTSTLALNVVEATGWINSVNDVSTLISAPTINTLFIKGAMQAGLAISGAVPFDLGTVRITGALTDGYWNVASGARTVSLTSVTSAFGGANFAGTLNVMAVAGALPVDVSAATINTLSVRGNLTGDVTAGTARTIAVTGQIVGSDLTFTGAGTDLRTLSVPGGIVDSTLDATANVGTIAAGLLTGDTITAGVTTTGVTIDNATLATIGAATITNIHVVGKAAAFNDTTIIAHTITGSLGPINGSNGGTAEGLALVSTRSLTANENGTVVRVTPKSTPPITPFGDFQINLITA